MVIKIIKMNLFLKTIENLKKLSSHSLGNEITSFNNLLFFLLLLNKKPNLKYCTTFNNKVLIFFNLLLICFMDMKT